MSDLNLDQLARAEALVRARNGLPEAPMQEVLDAAEWIFSGSVSDELLPAAQPMPWEPIKVNHPNDDTSSIPSLGDLPQFPIPE